MEELIQGGALYLDPVKFSLFSPQPVSQSILVVFTHTNLRSMHECKFQPTYRKSFADKREGEGGDAGASEGAVGARRLVEASYGAQPLLNCPTKGHVWAGTCHLLVIF